MITKQYCGNKFKTKHRNTMNAFHVRSIWFLGQQIAQKKYLLDLMHLVLEKRSNSLRIQIIIGWIYNRVLMTNDFNPLRSTLLKWCTPSFDILQPPISHIHYSILVTKYSIANLILTISLSPCLRYCCDLHSTHRTQFDEP